MPAGDRQIYEVATYSRVRISFHSDDGFDGLVTAESPQFGRILSCRTEKQFGGASGTWSITFKKEQNLFGAASALRLWPDPEDTWVKIAWVVDGQVIDGMWGLIDSISESSTRDDKGGRVESYTIHGRDVGKVLESVELFVNLYDGGGVRSAVGLYDAMASNVVGNPATFIRALLSTWLGNEDIGESQWELPASMETLSFYEALNLETIQEMNDGNGILSDPTIMSVDQGGGKSLWAAMQQYQNGLMNEMWIDLAPNPDSDSTAPLSRQHSDLRPALYLREKPFPTRTSRQHWDALRRRTLALGDVRNRNIAKGGAANRYNYWNLRAGGIIGRSYASSAILQDGVQGVEAGRPGSIPIWNRASIRKHGVRRWEQETQFLPLLQRSDSSQPTRNWIHLAANWLRRNHDWYSVAPYQLSGSLVTTRIMPEIRIGERVLEKRTEGDIEYYCEGVVNELNYPGAGKTTLTLTRGSFVDKDLLNYVYDELENPPPTARERCFIEEPTSADAFDETISQLARGCTVRAPQGSRQRSSGGRVLLDDEQGESGADLFSVEEQGGGRPSEGGQADRPASSSRSRDIEMVPDAQSVDQAAAQRAAETGEAEVPVTRSSDRQDTETQRDDSSGSGVGLTQEELERGDPIRVDELSNDELFGGLEP